MTTRKYLVLNSTQEKELIAQGSVVVYSKGYAYNVFKDENGQISITSAGYLIKVCNPLDYDIVLTHIESKELMKTGKTTHTKGGKTFDITLENGHILATIKCDYTDIITPSMR